MHHTRTPQCQKSQYKDYGKKQAQSGQVLLLLIMIMGTVLVLAMMAIFQSTSETQLSGATQESQRVMSAAEAALEKAFLNPDLAEGGASFADLGLTSLSGIDLEQSSVRVETRREQEIIVPKLDDQQIHTVYMSDYMPGEPEAQDGTFGAPYGGRFQVWYTSNQTGETVCNDMALEFIIVYDYEMDTDDFYEVKTLIADAGDSIDSTLTDPMNFDDDDIFYDKLTDDKEEGWGVLSNDSDVQYQCQTHFIDTEYYPNIRMILVKAHFESTRVAFVTGNRDGAPLGEELPYFPPQGRTFVAIARGGSFEPTLTPGAGEELSSVGGIQREVVIFQSYPQLMSELFTTTL